MEMNCINSLAEVGVGINMAFSLIKGLRENFFSLLENRLRTKVDKIQATLSEVATKNGAASSVAVRTDDIKQNYSDRGRKLTNLMIPIALLSAASLVYFLFESALDSKKDVSGLFAYIATSVAVGPLIVASLGQLVLFVIASVQLNKRLSTYEIYAKVALESVSEINPKMPTR